MLHLTLFGADIGPKVCVGVMLLLWGLLWANHRGVLIFALRLLGVATCTALVGVLVWTLRGGTHLSPQTLWAVTITMVCLTAFVVAIDANGVWARTWGALVVAVIAQAGFLFVSAVLIGPRWSSTTKFVATIWFVGLTLLVQSHLQWRRYRWGFSLLRMFTMFVICAWTSDTPMWTVGCWVLAFGVLEVVVTKRLASNRPVPRDGLRQNIDATDWALRELQRRAGQEPQVPPRGQADLQEAMEAFRRRADQEPQVPPRVQEAVEVLQRRAGQGPVEAPRAEPATSPPPTWYDKIMKDDT